MNSQCASRFDGLSESSVSFSVTVQASALATKVTSIGATNLYPCSSTKAVERKRIFL